VERRGCHAARVAFARHECDGQRDRGR
jgi:hypothetical protein